MPTNNLQSNNKIPLYRRRWVWGVVMGMVTIISASFICLKFNISIKDYFTFLPTGFLLFISSISFGFLHFLFISITTTFPSLKFILFCLGYYFFTILLIYQSFKNKQVKILYPILYIFLLGVSVAGYYVLIKAMSNF
jgi:hypothetical protein